MGDDGYEWRLTVKGGPGSGHWGHAGRPGQVGGSVSRDIAMNIVTGRNWERRQAEARFSSAAQAANVTKSRYLGGGVVGAELVEYKDDGKGVWKDAQGWPGGHDPNSEVAASRIDNLLGLDIVPETVFAKHEGKDGTSQYFIEGARSGFELSDEYGYEAMENILYGNREFVTKMVLLDYITGNTDRHDGNWVEDQNGRLWAVDHGHSGWDRNRRAGINHAVQYLDAPRGRTTLELPNALLKNIRTVTRTKFDKAMEGVSQNGNVNLDSAWNRIAAVQRKGYIIWQQ